MGHVVNEDRQYRLLQRQLDRSVTGAPDSPTFMKILRLLFSPEEAELARRIPSRPTSLGSLVRRLGIPRDELDGRLTELARRGLVLDMECKGRRYFALPPVVIGFFEFTFMRTREDVPLAELAVLFEEYMNEDDRFARSAFAGKTQLARSLVHEEALPEGDHTEVLDWERASQIVRSASTVGVSLCPCRHKARHLGTACDRIQRCCLSLDYAADAMIRTGGSERITNAEAMRILDECKQAGLAQTGDNVQRKVSFICNCCGCCCGLVEAIKTFNLRGAIITSNWIVSIDAARCKGCGKCVAACPVGAIALGEKSNGQPARRLAAADEGLCLGCGVCHGACRSGAISMKPRPKRVYTPETLFDRTMAMAIERGKLTELLFDNPERLSHRALQRIVWLVEHSPVFKAAMAVKPLRSAFLNFLVGAAKRSAGEVGKMVE